MKKVTLVPPFLVVLILMITSCSTMQYVPVETIEKIEYRDSLVYVNDTILVEVPVEKIVQIQPADTTSQISTSLAFSEAKIDKGILTHTLEQKGSVKVKYDTIIKVEYIDRILEKEVPIEVEKKVEVVPKWSWYVLMYSIVLTLLLVFYIYLKLFR